MVTMENELGFKLEVLDSVEKTEYPLTLVIIPGKELLCEIGYNTAYYDRCSIEQFMDHFKNLICMMIENASAKISELSFLSEFRKTTIVSGME